MEIKIKSMQFRMSGRRGGKWNKSRIYIHPSGESILENLAQRTGRPHREFRKQVLPELFRYLDLPEDTKVRWNQYAGCSVCPCSPGFVVQGSNLIGPNGWPMDVFLDVEGADCEARDVAAVL